MDNFIVSARKYRPATFDTVVGQSSITSTLKNAILNKQLAQAFLFCGPRGVGKTTCARILAKTINCLNPVNKVEACEKCESCQSFNRSASFNIHELDAASNNSVDDIRNLVDQVRVPPQVGKYKVYIIDEVHMLSPSAFNAFLKTLEEPPPYAKFILATTEKHKIIPTILSRCQIFDFKRISVKDIAGYLEYVAKNEDVEADEGALHLIAQKADGAMRDALSFFDQLVSFSGNKISYETVTEHLNILDHSFYFTIMDQVLDTDTSGVLLTIDEIIGRGFDGQNFLTGLGEHLRNLLICKDPATISLMEINPNLQKQYAEQSGKCATEFLLKALEAYNKADQNYKTSNNKRLLLEITLLQFCTLVTPSDSPKEKKSALKPPDGAKEKTPVDKIAPATPTAKKEKATKAKTEKTVTVDSKVVSRTISIKPKSKDTVATEKNDNESVSEEKANMPFTEDKLEKVWVYYTESIAGQYPNLYSILSTRKPKLLESGNIALQLDNKAQEITMKERMGDLLDFLRTELSNPKILIETKLAENAQSSRPYTAEEKFKAMTEKNPEIKTFKETLDLDLEL
jgi:DNA polymerase-3 subunit gamma/tau